MKIIGRLIKKTTELGYRRINRKLIGYQHQLQVLSNLVNKAKNTDFGKKYNFNNWLKKKGFVSLYQENIPIQDYDSFYGDSFEIYNEDDEESGDA